MKRILTILFATMLAGQVLADNPYYNEIAGLAFSYINGTGNWKVSGMASNNSSQIISIPDHITVSGELCSVTEIGDEAFKNSGITSVYIPSSITKIGQSAFSDCSKLNTVFIPQSVKSIGDNAFGSTTLLCESESKPSGWNIPDTNVVWNVKWNDALLYTVTNTPSNTAEIVGYVGTFDKCDIPETITVETIDYEVARIAANAFKYCNGNKITIPSSVLSVGGDAFLNSSFTSLITINSDADFTNANLIFTKDDFRYCVLNKNTVKVVEIPKSDVVTIPASVDFGNTFTVASINSSAFNNCYLTSLTINAGCDVDFNDSGLCFNVDGIKYKVLNNSSVEVAPYSYSGDVVIPATVDFVNTFSVTSIDGTAFKNCNLTSLIINADCNDDLSASILMFSEEGIEYKIMGKNSVMVIAIPLSGDVVIPNTVSFGDTYAVTSINGYAFNNCNLTSLTINADCDVDFSNVYFTKDNVRYKILDSNSVEVVANSYSGEVTIPATVDFCNNTYTVASISDNAFAGSTSIDYMLDNGCKYIGNQANPYLILLGANSTSITSVEIDSNCKFICSGAFSGCNKLTSIIIPESVVGIGSDAFKGCSSLTKAEYASIDNLCKIKFGNNDANPLNNAQHLYINGEELTELVIPEGVTNIDYVFCGCNSFVSVTTNSDVDYNRAGLSFTKDDIRYLVLSKNEVEVSAHTYSGDIVIPESVTAGSTFSVIAIGRKAFFECEKLSSIVIPESVTKIGGQAFYGCKALKKVTIPNSVTSIGDSVFFNCSALTTVTLPNSVIDIGKYAFYYCSSLTTVIIPKSITRIDDAAFYMCKSLSDFTIPNSVTSIGNSAFCGCMGLTFVNIPDEVTQIGQNAFERCNNLKLVSIPASVTYIGKGAFCSENITIYCEQQNKPEGWSWTPFNKDSDYWNYNKGSVVWGIKAQINDDYIYKVTSDKEPYTIEIYKYLSDNKKVIICESETFDGVEYQVAGIATLDKKVGKIVCMSKMPIALSSDPFPQNDTIYVPATSLNEYKTSTVWKRKVIVPFYVVATKSADVATGIVQGDSLLLGSLTIKAMPANGYHFVCWSDGNKDAERILTTAPSDTLVATFEAHSEVIDTAVAATCTESGLTEGKHCSVCKVVLIAQNTIAALGHTEVVDATVAATCTESGKTEGSHCSVCNEVIVAQEVIPALGHTVVVDTAVAATATEFGLTEGSHCSVCGLIIVAQDTIPALGEQGGENTNPTTAVSESAANTVNIYAHGNTIVVENATEEIRVYNAMGALVGRDVARNVSTITINTTGVYIVKTGDVVKRVVVD